MILATPPRGPLTRLQSGQIVRETEEYEFVQESDVSQADIRPIELVRLNDESETDDPRFPADDSMDQETSQSLIPLSQTQDPGSSIADSSQSKPWDWWYSWVLSAPNQKGPKGSSSDKVREGNGN